MSMQKADTALQMAIAQFSAGRMTEAEANCRAILMANPRQAQALQILGCIALQRGNAEDAVEHLRRSAAAAPRVAEPRSNLGAALLAKKQFKEAIATLKDAIKIDPKLASAYVNLGAAYMEVDQPREAADALRRAVALQPNDAKAHLNLGAALSRLDRREEAVRVLLKALELNPRLAQAYENLGGAYQALGRFDDAIACHDKALELDPAYSDARVQRGMAYLVTGRFAEGWRDYLDRQMIQSSTLSLHRQPLGPDLSGKRILLGKEQGIGDEIMFLRWASELKRRGAHVSYFAGAKIATLLQRVPFLDAIVDDETAGNPSDWDLVVSVGDLPFMLGATSAEDIPPSIDIPILPDRSEAQHAALAALGPPPYVGVTWRGGTKEKGKLFKHAPLERIGAVLQQVRGTLIALQRLPDRGEIRDLAKAAGRPVHDFTPLNEKLEDMLALVSLLDEYVAVSNTNVHLRAATGRGSRVLVPNPPEFRWMSAGSVSPWFRDCVVYRQQVGGSWDNALSDLARDLVAALGKAAR